MSSSLVNRDIQNDGSLDSSEVWYSLPHSEISWRESAKWMHLFEPVLTGPYDYRYTQESHLKQPWDKNRVLAMVWVERVLNYYSIWRAPISVGISWPLVDDSDDTKPAAIRVFEKAQRLFEEVGLRDQVQFVKDCWEKYDRLVYLMDAQIPWKPFQIDLNSPSVFTLVTGADQWQHIVWRVQQERHDGVSFLQNMRMASVEYILRELPGPHDEPNRVHEADNPLGYGVSTDSPSFGYRREHRTEIVFAGWASAVMPNVDLFGPMFWDTE